MNRGTGHNSPDLCGLFAALPPAVRPDNHRMQFFGPRRLSCGIVILNADRELLLCHVTGQNHWDLPKGGIDTNETPIAAALRETREESGWRLSPDALIELGRFRYTSKKNLHLFATLQPRIDVKELRCESHYVERHSGRRLPEMDGFGWFDLARVNALCTPKMASVLNSQIGLERVLDRLLAAGDRTERLAANA